MKRSLALSGLLAVLISACSSLNPFGGSDEKPAVAPPAAGAEGAPGEQSAPRKRARESEKLVRFDVNGDGAVANAELEETLMADFKKEDANGDEVLDVGETRKLNERLREEKSASPVFDWNADGQLVYTEFASQWRTLFQRADVDRDGIVDSEELTGQVRERTPRPLPKPEFSGKDGRPPGSN
jgi:Ca2+-binding EF-hand superfamily protein